jgi:prevent-host-death family protein
MAATNATTARQNLFKLIEQVNADHEPVLITGKRGSAVLLSEEDWHAIEETLYLNSIPGIAESIQEGLKTPVSDLEDTLEW